MVAIELLVTVNLVVDSADAFVIIITEKLSLEGYVKYIDDIKFLMTCKVSYVHCDIARLLLICFRSFFTL